MRIQGLTIPLNVFTNNAPLILLGVSTYFKYSDGVKTDEIGGYKYMVVDTESYEKFGVKVESIKAFITQEQLAMAKEKVFVTFDNAMGKIYRAASGEYEVSFNATGISIVK